MDVKEILQEMNRGAKIHKAAMIYRVMCNESDKDTRDRLFNQIRAIQNQLGVTDYEMLCLVKSEDNTAIKLVDKVTEIEDNVINVDFKNRKRV